MATLGGFSGRSAASCECPALSSGKANTGSKEATKIDPTSSNVDEFNGVGLRLAGKPAVLTPPRIGTNIQISTAVTDQAKDTEEQIASRTTEEQHALNRDVEKKLVFSRVGKLQAFWSSAEQSPFREATKQHSPGEETELPGNLGRAGYVPPNTLSDSKMRSQDDVGQAFFEETAGLFGVQDSAQSFRENLPELPDVQGTNAPLGFRLPKSRAEYKSFFLHFAVPRPFYKSFSFV